MIKRDGFDRLIIGRGGIHLNQGGRHAVLGIIWTLPNRMLYLAFNLSWSKNRWFHIIWLGRQKNLRIQWKRKTFFERGTA